MVPLRQFSKCKSYQIPNYLFSKFLFSRNAKLIFQYIPSRNLDLREDAYQIKSPNHQTDPQQWNVFVNIRFRVASKISRDSKKRFRPFTVHNNHRTPNHNRSPMTSSTRACAVTRGVAEEVIHPPIRTSARAIHTEAEVSRM